MMMMLFWFVPLVAIIWFVWALSRRGGYGWGPAAREDGAEALLRERYARGEIDEATLRRMLDELRRQ